MPYIFIPRLKGFVFGKIFINFYLINKKLISFFGQKDKPIFLGSGPELGNGTSSSKDDQEQDDEEDSSFNPLNWLRSDDDSASDEP